ncbi:MAG: ABC transporter permease subunit [Planctomycetes bacterium]|nr:ABC transporter permease subunit [Planctomycetota bacterium]
MSKSLVLAGKEFRSYFSSWLAYIFIALFVAAALVSFFFLAGFFADGRAELRGYFSWLPLTLAILVPGLTMRQWAKENEMGSIELLMTLPAHTRDLVLGKFLGTMGFVAVALLFTLGIPITVEILGDLDWGPVVGGYAAALLLGGAYVAIGLYVSSWFHDQFPALLVGWLLCGLLAAVGHETVLGWCEALPAFVSRTFAFVGFWDRFRAIERGVLDLRDVAYYLSVTGLFLYLNVARIRTKRWTA